MASASTPRSGDNRSGRKKQKVAAVSRSRGQGGGQGRGPKNGNVAPKGQGGPKATAGSARAAAVAKAEAAAEAAAEAGAKVDGPTLDLKALKQKTAKELAEVGRDLGVEGALSLLWLMAFGGAAAAGAGRRVS